MQGSLCVFGRFIIAKVYQPMKYTPQLYGQVSNRVPMQVVRKSFTDVHLPLQVHPDVIVLIPPPRAPVRNRLLRSSLSRTRLASVHLRDGCGDVSVERMMSNQVHNSSTFEHLVRPDPKVGDEYANTSILDKNGYTKAMSALGDDVDDTL